jgi:hypothetical protein
LTYPDSTKAQHFNVRNAIFQVRLACIDKAMPNIKSIQMLLCPDANGLRTPVLLQANNSLMHQHMAYTRAPDMGAGYDPAYAGLSELYAACKAACIRHQLVTLLAKQVHRAVIGTVQVLKYTSLLDNKNFSAELQDSVKLLFGQRIKRFEFPYQALHAQATTFSW